MDCPDGQVRYQAQGYVTVGTSLLAVWEVRCLPSTYEVSQLVMAELLIAEDAEGQFPSPVVVPTRCCGQARI